MPHRTTLTLALSALAATTALLFVALPAGAATYLHRGTTTGNLVASGSAIYTSLPAGTSVTVTTDWQIAACTTTSLGFTTTVGSGGATIPATLTALTLGSGSAPCHDVVGGGGVALTSCALYQDASNPSSWSNAGTGSLAGIVTMSFTLGCQPTLGTTCYYRATNQNASVTDTASGTTLTGSQLRFNNIVLPQSSSPMSGITCRPTATIVGTFGSLFDTGNTIVGLNNAA